MSITRRTRTTRREGKRDLFTLKLNIEFCISLMENNVNVLIESYSSDAMPDVYIYVIVPLIFVILEFGLTHSSKIINYAIE